MQTFPRPLSNGTSGQGTERRSRAAKHKEAIFYDSGERRRLWLAVAGLLAVNLVQLLVNLALVVLVVWLVNVALHTKVVALMMHDDKRPTTVIGELHPLHGDATLDLLQSNAMHYVDDLFTVTSFNNLTRNKDSVLTRTAAATQAETFVRATFDDHFKAYQKGDQRVAHIDCRNEGRWTGPTTAMRFDCFYQIEPVDGSAAAQPNARPMRYESHLEIIQSRGTTNPNLLYTNPDEVYVTHIDQQALP